MQHALVITGDENVINFIIHERASLPIRFTHHADIFKGLKQLTYKYFDILIFDIDLPGLDAVHALDIAKSVQKGLHIIIITHDAHILHNKSLNKHCIDFLLFKPIQFEQLVGHLKFISVNRESNSYIRLRSQYPEGSSDIKFLGSLNKKRLD